MRNLGETAGLMVADDYRYRMVAELAQLYIRKQGAELSICANPASTSGYLLEDQLNGMNRYMRALEERLDNAFGGDISKAILCWAMSDSSEPLVYATQRWREEQGNKED